MTNHLSSAGYIVTDRARSAIYGFGPNEDDAWENFVNEMEMARITVVGEIDDAEIACEYPHETPANKYQIFAATRALLDRVGEVGGNISWALVGCVACLPEERDD